VNASESGPKVDSAFGTHPLWIVTEIGQAAAYSDKVERNGIAQDAVAEESELYGADAVSAAEGLYWSPLMLW